MNSSTPHSSLTPSEVRSIGKVKTGISLTLYGTLLILGATVSPSVIVFVIRLLNTSIGIRFLPFLGWLPAIALWMHITGSLLGTAGAVLLLGAPERSRTFRPALGYVVLVVLGGVYTALSYAYSVQFLLLSLQYMVWVNIAHTAFQFLQRLALALIVRRLALFVQASEIARSAVYFSVLLLFSALSSITFMFLPIELPMILQFVKVMLAICTTVVVTLWMINLCVRIRSQLHAAATDSVAAKITVGLPLRWGWICFLTLEALILADFLMMGTSLKAGVLNWPRRFAQGPFSGGITADWAKDAWVFFAVPVFLWLVVRSRPDQPIFMKRFPRLSFSFGAVFLAALGATVMFIHQEREEYLAKHGSFEERLRPPTLIVGHRAPPFEYEKIANWKPDPVMEPGRVYVVEFWATWCRPCIDNIPHMNSLASKFENDVTFLSVTTESEETVRSFLSSKGSDGKPWVQVIQYPLIVDSLNRMQRSYFLASRQDAIPTAFVIGKDGNIEWIGHPAVMEEVLQEVVAGTFDRHEYQLRRARLRPR